MTTYETATGSYAADRYETACADAQRQSREARDDVRVWLRDPRLASDVLVARYRDGEELEAGDVPRDVVLASLND